VYILILDIVLHEVFHEFHQFLQENGGLVSKIRPRPFPSTSYSLHYSLIILSFDANNILVGRPEGRRPLGRPRRRWEDNIKMDLRGIGFGDVDWIHWTQDRDRWRALVNTVMNRRVP
jgi:hypothetical protein